MASSSSSNHSQKQSDGSKQLETEEIVRYMSNLPSYLERGKPIQDRALSFGVMDWGRLEQWQYHHQKPGVVINNKYSPSSSNSSLLSSTGGSSLHSSSVQNSSHAARKPHQVTLRSHLNISPEEISSKDSQVNHSSEKKTTNRSRPKSRVVKKNDFYSQNIHESKSSDDTSSFQTASSSLSSKGKKKIQEDFQDPYNATCDGTLLDSNKTLVLGGKKYEDFHSDLNSDIPNSFLFENEVVNRKYSQNEAKSKRNPRSASQIKTTEEKEFIASLKTSGGKKGVVAVSKERSSFSMSSKSAAPTSVTKTVELPPVSQNSTKGGSTVSQRNNSSPLRRLLNPLFSSKATSVEKSHEDLHIKAKVKMDLRNCKDIRVDNSCRNKSSTKQALFQMAIKNGRPLFTFAVENNIDILAATVRSLTGKDDTNSWIYTFFTVHEVKKKKGGWLSHGTKGTNHGYLPNVTAQMTVTNRLISDCATREFVLSSANPGQTDNQILEAQLEKELAAIVVQFLKKKAEEEENQDCFSTTVILPGGHHSVPRKGEPSPLIERWQSGGVCDCGGWDVGCRLRTLTNTMQSVSSGKFELFFQGEVISERPFFSLSPLQEGIYSVEYNSSLSLLHAFSICISVMECRKSSDHSELRTYIAKQVDDDECPVTYASLPPVSPVGRV